MGSSAWLLALAFLTTPLAAAALPGSANGFDPLAAGRLRVATTEFDLGTVELGLPPSEPLEARMRGVMHRPESPGGRWPVAIFLHGMATGCSQPIAGEHTPTVSLEFDDALGFIEAPGEDIPAQLLGCEGTPVPGRGPMPNHRGYDYLGRDLASHGVLVVSLLAFEINTYDDQRPDGPWMRGQLMLLMLDALRGMNAVPTEGFRELRGRLDLDRVGLMGHSRGGGGVFTAQALNAERDAPFGLRALVALAPTAWVPSTLDTEISTMFVVPYCDGDVFTLDGITMFDESRDAPASGPKFLATLMGANHNHFNTVWGDERLGLVPIGDDHLAQYSPHCRLRADLAPGVGGRLSAHEQRQAGVLYVGGFLRWSLLGEAALLPYLTGAQPPPPAACAGGNECARSVHAAAYAGPEDRLVLEDARGDEGFTRNDLGGSVTASGFQTLGFCHALAWVPEASLDCPWPVTYGGARYMVVSWAQTASIRSTLPEGMGDLRGYDVLSLRVGVPAYRPENPFGEDPVFRIVLEDAKGGSAAVRSDLLSAALHYPPDANPALAPILETDQGADANRAALRVLIDAGRRFLPPPGKVVAHELRIPLEAFDGVDLGEVSAVSLVFDQTPTGIIQFNDWMAQREPGRATAMA